MDIARQGAAMGRSPEMSIASTEITKIMHHIKDLPKAIDFVHIEFKQQKRS